ncbi:MAG TPA: metal-sensitive transcriptional regulator [Casimicrobiaceae bacterium]
MNNAPKHNHAEHHHARHAASGRLCVPTDTRAVVTRRLSIARGHVEGILKLLQKDDVYCVDVLKQIQAVGGALQKAGEITLEGHLRAHVATAAERGDAERVIAELMDALRYR